MRVIIDIEVTNPEEVLKTHRGEILGMIAGVVLSKEKNKYKVEKAICNEIIKVIDVELPKALKEEYVEADLNYYVEEN